MQYIFKIQTIVSEVLARLFLLATADAIHNYSKIINL